MKDRGKSEEIKIQGLYSSISSICLASLLKTLSLKKKYTKLYHTGGTNPVEGVTG